MRRVAFYQSKRVLRGLGPEQLALAGEINDSETMNHAESCNVVAGAESRVLGILAAFL